MTLIKICLICGQSMNPHTKLFGDNRQVVVSGESANLHGAFGEQKYVSKYNIF
jgi:hypothetical protein